MDVSQKYPLPVREQLVSEYVGKSLHQVPLPSAILDVSKLRRNCQLMLDAVTELGVEFRAHVKTHKTLELSRLQVGTDSKDVRLICSTIAELEHLQPLVKEFQQQGASVNVLYGIPPSLSSIPRLAKFLQANGPGTLTLMIDNPAQLSVVTEIHSQTSTPVGVFLKTDSGYHRAGLPPTSPSMQSLVNETLALESQSYLYLIGFYSHNSHSYAGNSPMEAMDNLREEVVACTEAALANSPSSYITSRSRPLQISCGASPTALSLQNLLPNSQDTITTTSAEYLRASLAKAASSNIRFEIHAGVYPTLDMQQISASSRTPTIVAGSTSTHQEDSIAISILSEIVSTYPDRTDHPEALVNAGCIALAREPCKSYRGHGVISPWNMEDGYNAYELKDRIIVDRVSQEHGLLQWEDRSKKEALPFTYGQRLRIWPNHACITGSQYGWYLIVDGSDTIVDVWIRWRGW